MNNSNLIIILLVLSLILNMVSVFMVSKEKSSEEDYASKTIPWISASNVAGGFQINKQTKPLPKRR